VICRALGRRLRPLVVWLYLFIQIKQGSLCKDNQHEKRELLSWLIATTSAAAVHMTDCGSTTLLLILPGSELFDMTVSLLDQAPLRDSGRSA
jgi:hypothetical protein